MKPALFANAKKTIERSTVALVEDVLQAHGHRHCAQTNLPVGELAGWRLTHGSASIEVTVYDRQPAPRLRLQATVQTLDARVDRLALFRYLLTETLELGGLTFGLAEPYVVVFGERSTVDLSRNEFEELFVLLCQTADKYDDLLVKQFGGVRGAR